MSESARTFAHLTISAQDLMAALEANPMQEYWLADLETGELIRRPEDEGFLDEDEDPEAYDDPDRYMTVEPMGSPECFQVMASYVESLPDGEAARSLDRSLRMRRPFRAFKDTLLDFPEERQKWFKFHDAVMLGWAQQWVEDNLPGAVLVFP